MNDWLTLDSMLGGGMMFAIGALYLLFEERILSEGGSGSVKTESSTHLKSRIVLGVQVGCYFEGQYTCANR
jgi:phosphatidylinositol glycan class N